MSISYSFVDILKEVCQYTQRHADILRVGKLKNYYCQFTFANIIFYFICDLLFFFFLILRALYLVHSLYGKYLTCKIVGQTSLLVKPMSQIIPTVHQKKYDFIFKSNI